MTYLYTLNMTKKITHKDYVDYNFSLIGICTQEADYKICHLLNRKFEIDFERINDIEILLPKQSNVVKFSCFKYEDEDADLFWYLTANRNPAINLLPEQKQADFLLRVIGESDQNNPEDFLARIKEIKTVLTAFVIDPHRIKSIENILF